MEGVLAVLGLVLELGGIGVALWGLEELSGELFPNRPLPHRAALRRVKRALGVKPRTTMSLMSTVPDIHTFPQSRGGTATGGRHRTTLPWRNGTSTGNPA